MKKRLLSIIMAAILIASLAGCGGKTAEKEEKKTETTQTEAAKEERPEKTEDSKPTETAEEASDNAESKVDGPEISAKEIELGEGDGVSDVRDRLTGEKLLTHNGAVMFYTDTEVEMEDEYLIEGGIAELMTDRAVDRGWSYYYIDSLDDGAPILDWYPQDDYFTSVAIVLRWTNLSDTPVVFAENAATEIVFDEGGKNKVYKGVSFQSNPGILDEWGYENTRNATFKELEKDDYSAVSFIVDVDKEFHDAMVAEDPKEATWAYISFPNGDLYCMNLRTEMIRFGYDDSDDESEITDNVHKTMQSATGVEYLTDFLKSRTDFMQIADLAGIDPEELAEGYASHFEVKVTDIQFDDETHATAYCTVTSPDFVRMYENLDSIAEDKMANIDKDNLTEEEFYKIYGDMLTEYTTDKFFPHMTHDMEISYVYDDGFEIWTPEDKEAVVNEMRIALMNF